ncbi:MAG: VacJ family lipoprotein [Victivallales bacterium]|nr:VacJ family lipoprotein [Victivallales bacterium]
MRISPSIRLLALLSAVLLCGCATLPKRPNAYRAHCSSDNTSAPVGAVLYDAPINDPLEGANRAVMYFNGALNNYLLYPFGVFYKWAAPQCVRTGIGNFAHNLSYPLRLASTCLQGDWSGAWDETRRFGVNTTVGVLGFRDQASRWEIPRHDEDFGQTFAVWGMGPGCYLNLPFLGSSSARDAAGYLLGLPFNLASILLPSEPALAVNGSCTLSRALDNAPGVRQLSETIYSPYELARLASVIDREADVNCIDLPAPPPNPEPSLEALQLKPHGELFRDSGIDHAIQLTPGARPLRYTCWPRKRFDRSGKPPRVLVILPGLGGHRLDNATCAMAELFHERGWSVIAFSSTMTPEFIRATSTADTASAPGNFLQDVVALEKGVSLALADFARRHPGRGGESCSILGWSLGGINTLFLAARKLSFRCDRFLALNPPLRPFHALQVIDEWARLPEKWDVPDKEAAVRDLARRIAGLLNSGDTCAMELPLTREESKYLIGLYMHLPLLDVMTCLTRLRNQTVRQQGFQYAAPTLADAINCGWTGYAQVDVLPQYCATKKQQAELPQMADELAITAHTSELAANPRVFVIHNADDFLVTETDLEWYRTTLGPRATILPDGGHTGNHHRPDYQKRVLEILD